MTTTEKVCHLFGKDPPNQDKESGIHYGVIRSNRLNDFALDDIWNDGTDLAWEDWRLAIERIVPELTEMVLQHAEEYANPTEVELWLKKLQRHAEEQDLYLDMDSIQRIWYEADNRPAAEIIEEVIQLEAPMVDFQETTYRYEKDGYLVELHADMDVWVIKSPYYTRCAECSPCAPNAGYLTSQHGGMKTYCLGPEWFDEEGKEDRAPIPYSIWKVEDDTPVHQLKEEEEE